MPPPLENLDVRSRQQWRAWLKTHHASSPGIWFVFYKKHAAMTSIPYEDAIREALCFGWVDSLVKRLDDDRFVLKFTPRKPDQQMVGQQPPALGGARRGRGAGARRARCRTDRQPLRAAARHSDAAGVHRQKAEDEPEGVGLLSIAVADKPAQLRRLDPHGEAPGHARETPARIRHAARGAQTARPEVNGVVERAGISRTRGAGNRSATR